MSKKLLTKKILCSVLAAGAFGVMYNPMADAATANGQELTATDGVVTVNNDTLTSVSSKKFIFGQGDNLSIQTAHSIDNLFSALKTDSSITGIQNALGQNAVMGVVGGEGQLDENLYKVTGALSKVSPIISKIHNIDTVKNTNEVSIKGNTNITIGTLNSSTNTSTQTSDEKPTKPLVIGAVGGDLSINTGLNSTNETTNNLLKLLGINIENPPADTSINRTGNTNMTINNGTVVGGIGGSAAIATSNLNATIEKSVLTAKVNLGTEDSKASATTNITGNVNVNVNKNANVVGFTGGGMAMGIGGNAASNVSGDVNINIDSTNASTPGENNQNWDDINGLTAGIAGGGTAVTTIGGTAQSTVGGNTSITIKNGVSAGVLGGGLAASIDVTNISDGIKETDNKISIGSINATIGITNGNLNNGGTATSNVKGDTNISLEGKTSAAGIIGGGMAVATNNQGDYKAADETYSSSIANASTGKTNIIVNVENGMSDVTIKDKVINALKNLKSDEENETKPIDIKNLSNALSTVKDKGVVVGVTGGGVSIAQGKEPDKTNYSDSIISEENNPNQQWAEAFKKETAGAHATSKNEGAQIDLVNGYVVGTFGGGIASAKNNSTATSETTGDITINVGNDTEAIGVFGNGLAYYTGVADAGRNNLIGKASVTATNSTINIGMNYTNTANDANTNTTVDGVFGGGIAIDDSQADRTNASVETTGKSTINVYGEKNNTKDGYSTVISKINLQPIAGTVPNDDITMATYLNGIKDTINAGNVAIAGGGVAVGGGAESKVANAEININGGKVDGSIIGGGIAAMGHNDSENEPIGGSTVDNATINLNGGVVTGNVYAGGAANTYDYRTESGKEYDQAQSIVNTATVNWRDTDVEGQLKGTGYSINNGDITDVDVANSTLNVYGEHTLSLVDNKSKITGFDNVNFAENSVTKVDGSLESSNSTALIDLDNASGENQDGTIKVANSARLDITELKAKTETPESQDATYTIAKNYNTEDSTLWGNDQLAYDRTSYYATTHNDKDSSEYTVSYKDLSELSEEDQKAAVDDAVNSFGSNGKNARGILDGIIRNGANTNAGAKDLVGDLTSVDSKSAAEAGLYNVMMLGEDSGVTSNAISMTQDFADNAVLRLSFTQDNLSKAKLGDEGAVWAKYLHNKHELDDMGSSFGALNSSNSYDGIIVGTDFAKTGKVQSGIAFAYGDGDGHGMTTENDFDMWGLTLYGNIKNDDTNIIGDIGYSRSSNDIKSKILGNDFNTDRDLDIFTMGVRAEKLYTKGNTQIVPYTGLRYMSVNPDDYSTSYKGQNAFNYSADRQNIWTVPLGLSFRNETVTKNGWSITPKVDLAYIWAFGDTDNSLTVNAGSGYDVLDYTVMDDGSFLGSIGLDFNKDAWTYGLGYTYQKGSHAENNRWFVNVDYNF